MRRWSVPFMVAIALASTSASANQPVIGQASVIDGDTIEIHDTRIRLHGIDAPESGQLCRINAKPFRCGQLSAQALANKIGRQTVTCDPRDTDRYGRTVAVCSAGGANLNAWMVREGWALAYRQYSLDYVNAENAASASKRNLWQSEFQPPWEWRRQQRVEAPAPKREHGAQPECTIKGNISSRGERIYHVPGAEHYVSTRIDTSKGERWFCSEAEARAAGWRRSMR